MLTQTFIFDEKSGKVFVYTGILPICKDEDGLATVLAHEIAHVVAHHTAERASTDMIKRGLVYLAALLFNVSLSFPSTILSLTYSLPNSRTQEVFFFFFLTPFWMYVYGF